MRSKQGHQKPPPRDIRSQIPGGELEPDRVRLARFTSPALRQLIALSASVSICLKSKGGGGEGRGWVGAGGRRYIKSDNLVAGVTRE